MLRLAWLSVVLPPSLLQFKCNQTMLLVLPPSLLQFKCNQTMLVVLPPSLLQFKCNQTMLVNRIPRRGPKVEAQPEP